MRLITWNVNAFKALDNEVCGDLICLQEIKGREVKVDGYHVFQSRAALKGYSGVATLTKWDWRPFAVSDELIIHGKKDDQGRFLLTDHKQFILINVYFPFSSDAAKLSYKMDFHNAIADLINDLIKQNRSVIVVGDFNCIYDVQDSYYAKSNTASQMDPENNSMTEWFKGLINDALLIDAYRWIHPTTENSYTCWNTKLNSRIVNQGTRLDYILMSCNLSDNLSFADHLVQVQGSDHCPVYADLTIDPLIHDAQLYDQIGQPSIKEFFKKSDKKIDFVANIITKKQRKVSDYFSKPKEGVQAHDQAQGGNVDAFTEIIQYNKKLKRAIHTVSPKEDGVVSQWEQLFTPKPPPNCHHKEPCKEFKTKIKGPNTGR